MSISAISTWILAGRTEDERHAAYRKLFRFHLEPGKIDTIRNATNGNFVLGNNRF